MSPLSCWGTSRRNATTVAVKCQRVGVCLWEALLSSRWHTFEPPRPPRLGVMSIVSCEKFNTVAFPGKNPIGRYNEMDKPSIKLICFSFNYCIWVQIPFQKKMVLRTTVCFFRLQSHLGGRNWVLQWTSICHYTVWDDTPMGVWHRWRYPNTVLTSNSTIKCKYYNSACLLGNKKTIWPSILFTNTSNTQKLHYNSMTDFTNNNVDTANVQ